VIPGVPDLGVGPAPVPGRLDELAAGLHRLTAPNPGLMTGPGTNTYLLGAGTRRSNLAVVDPGPDDAKHRAAIVAAASTLGTIRWVLVTHTHPDHAPGAAALAEQTGAEVIGFGPAEGFAPDRCVGDGWTLRLAGGEGGEGGDGVGGVGAGEEITLEAVHTPGHASDHLCWLLRESGTLLTGDHVMHGSTVVIRPPDGDLGQYLASLVKVRDFTPAVQILAPGHGRLMTPVAPVIDALIAHRRGRHERVAEALSSLGEAGIDDLLPSVYDDVTEAQLPVARFSLWAHLRALAEEGRAQPMAVGLGPDTIETSWKSLSEGPA
jgi:glyoxylase-like metal-dependent hydrolase (beta-lactamase superfamily II)